MTDFSNVANPLTEEAAASADRSGAPPAIYNHALFSRVFQLQESTSAVEGDVSTLQADVSTLQTETASLLSTGQLRAPLSLTANGTWSTYIPVPTNGVTVTGIRFVTPTAFASALGTILLSVKKSSSAGNTLLAAATLDLEALPANGLVAASLTSTQADLELGGADTVYVAITSNNADATGPADAAACIVVDYTYTID